jgi:hypothetical protein
MTGRSPTHGVATVVRFNWPKYALALALVPVAIVTALVGPGPRVTAAVTVVAALGAAWGLSSLVASWWVYDHADVYGRIAGDTPPGPWVAVHAGFDEATPRLAGDHSVPAAVVSLRTLAGASIDRAARLRPAPGTPARPAALPLAAGRAARLYLSFAAHEVRDPGERAALFAGAALALAPGGELVVTEHVIDAANLAVYGPGALHFRPRRTWLALGAGAGLHLVDEVRLTPFVRRFTWRR